MRQNNLRILFLVLLSIFTGQKSSAANTINAVIGDVSFTAKYGYSPTATTDENLRIKTHLAYVENQLRRRDLSGLTTTQRINRSRLLDLLHDYWSTGIFPRNFDYPSERIPCFIDDDGRICAVGYLIEKTGGRAVAEEINAKFKYHYLLDMNDATVDSWIGASGLSKVECAMIQPEYSYMPPIQIEPTPWIYSGVTHFTPSPTTLELSLKAKVKSLTTKNDSLETRIDSLNVAVNNQSLQHDRLTQKTKLDQEKIASMTTSLKQKDAKLKWLGISLICVASLAVLMVLKQLFWRKRKPV